MRFSHPWALMEEGAAGFRSRFRNTKAPRRGGAAKSTVPARRGTAPADVVAKAKEVEFVAPEQTGNTPDAALPPGWSESDEQAPSSFTPAADWQEAGEYFSGEYLGRQDAVGPNKSRLYAFKAGDGSAVSIWGATALDARMDFLEPARGETLLIQYLGSVPTSRGLSDVKTFRVMRRK